MTKWNKQQSKSYEPLKDRTRNFLLDGIHRGILKPGSYLPTVREIARQLDVSTNVVFLAIKELREEGILERLENGRHQVRSRLSGDRQNRLTRVGFMGIGKDHILHPIYQSLHNYLVRLGSHVNVTVDCQLDLNHTLEEVEDGFYDFLVVADWLPEDAQRLCRCFTIGLDNWRDVQTDCVVETDHHKGGELAGRHLWERGCRKVAYWDNHPTGEARLRALPLRRLGFMKGWVESGGRLEDIEFYQLVESRAELKSQVAEAIKDCDGIFAFCDNVALGLWDILSELGVRVPQDIALMGYDGNYEAYRHDPPLTTVRQPCKEIAEAILELMIASQSGDTISIPQEQILIAPELTKGEST